MNRAFITMAVLTGLAGGFTTAAHADVVQVDFAASGVAASLQLTYGSTTDAKYPYGYEITGISGTFTDTNSGLNIVDAPVSMLVPIDPATPESGNFLAPHDFSRFAAGAGTLSYDNLFWPAGSPQTATSYPPHGGFLDIYGVLFDVGGGDVAGFWSDGTGPSGYGVAVANSDGTLDYQFTGVTAAVPEPASLALLGTGILGMIALRRRKAAA